MIFNSQSSRGPDSNYTKQLKSAFDKANKAITETDLKHRQANKQAMALIESKTEHGFLRNEKDEQIAMVWFDTEKK